ncbi:MAG: class I SAM-dependent methyltransferase [Actinomadura sp.]
MSPQTDSPPSPPTSIDDVRGWFPQLDQQLFTWFLERQAAAGTSGDIVELGAYLGKSAILIGRHLSAGETFTVCDLFDSPAPDGANQTEMHRSYATLTRTAFESNYLAFHDALPEIVQGPTSVILDHVRPDSCRFVHVDASHLYEHVRGDIDAARTALRPDGIVACDDYRSEHTPGVAAAVWHEVATGGLHPICITKQKLYGTWGDPAPVRQELLTWLADRDDCWHEVQQVNGEDVVRITPKSKKAPQKKRSGPDPAAAREIARLKERLREERDHLNAVRGSASFRIGRALTAMPRKMRRSGK